MHGLRWSGTYNQVHGVLLQILLQKANRRADPHASWIRAEKIASYPHCYFLQEAFVLGIYWIYFHSLLAMAGLAEQFLIDLIRLHNALLYDLNLCRNLSCK